MQRWIAAAAVGVILLGSGAIYGRRVYHENTPSAQWVPFALNPELPPEKIDDVIKELKSKLTETPVLTAISRDLSLATEWKLPNEAAAAAELQKRLFVKLGDMKSGVGTRPAILVGIRGKAKEREASAKIAVRMAQEVARILGLKVPQKP